jgi:hypothetical protein
LLLLVEELNLAIRLAEGQSTCYELESLQECLRVHILLGSFLSLVDDLVELSQVSLILVLLFFEFVFFAFTVLQIKDLKFQLIDLSKIVLR